MKRRTREIAKTLDAWVAELRVEDNEMRTDAVIRVVIAGISEGNCFGLDAILEGDQRVKSMRS